MPAAYAIPNEFDLFVRGNDAVRYHIDVEAENFAGGPTYVYEATWDGVVRNTVEEMRPHIVVKPVAG
jgi:hypothetical protein